MKRLILIDLLIALLIGISLACALLVLILISMLERYSKDLPEVIACAQYIVAFTVVSVLTAAAAYRLYQHKHVKGTLS